MAKTKTPDFDTAYAEAVRVIGGGSENKLAGRLDVTKQATQQWRSKKNLPLLRALQIEKLTGVPWQALSPKEARVLADTA